MISMEFKQRSRTEDQNSLGVSTQSEAIKEQEAGLAAEGDPGIAASVPVAGKGHTQFQQSEVGNLELRMAKH